MQPVKYLCVIAILFTSCRASRNIASTPNDEVKPTIAIAVSPNSSFSASAPPTTPESILDETTVPVVENFMKETPEVDEATTANEAITAKQTKKKITSFAQMKEMARSGEIAMSKKDMKTLNRLEKHYKGNYQQFRADAFEFTDKAKIIGGIGLLGLLLAIITGSAFGWFLFIVAALAFLLRYLNIIAF